MTNTAFTVLLTLFPQPPVQTEVFICHVEQHPVIA